MSADRNKVLIVDDDPSHLEIYGLLVGQAGYDAVPALVKFAGALFPEDDRIGVVILDYRLNSSKSSSELAQELRNQYPAAPIILLSDMWSLPSDVAPYVTDFVRKGEPAKLLGTLRRLLPRGNSSQEDESGRALRGSPKK